MRHLILFCALTVVGTAQAGEPDLRWLHGCWQRDGGANVEMWFRSGDDLLVGLNFDIGRPVFEYLRIEKANSEPVYVAQPGGRPPVHFALHRASDQHLIFANDAHDYPQRISYRRQGDELNATISAADGENAMEFAWRSVPCDGLVH